MKHAVLVLLVGLTLCPCQCAPKIGRVYKKSIQPAAIVSTVVATVVSVVRKTAELFKLSTPAFTYHMDDPEQRNSLITFLWTGDYINAIGRFTTSNPNLISFFQKQLLDDSTEPTRFHALTGFMPRWENVLMQMWRARSQKIVPFEAAALAIRMLHYQTPQAVWTAVTFFSDLAMSRTWTERLIEDALHPDRNPGCPYEVASGISGAIFDNFNIHIGHGAYSTIKSKGLHA